MVTSAVCQFLPVIVIHVASCKRKSNYASKDASSYAWVHNRITHKFNLDPTLCMKDHQYDYNNNKKILLSVLTYQRGYRVVFQNAWQRII